MMTCEHVKEGRWDAQLVPLIDALAFRGISVVAGCEYYSTPLKGPEDPHAAVQFSNLAMLHLFFGILCAAAAGGNPDLQRVLERLGVQRGDGFRVQLVYRPEIWTVQPLVIFPQDWIADLIPILKPLPKQE